jgi:hypothetical protein
MADPLAIRRQRLLEVGVDLGLRSLHSAGNERHRYLDAGKRDAGHHANQQPAEKWFVRHSFPSKRRESRLSP